MEREFVWSVFQNGDFEYIQAGRHNDSNVVGYLVTNDPVLFADLKSKFAIGSETFASKTFEQRGEAALATPEVLAIDEVTVAEPEIEIPVEQPAVSIQKLDAELACTEIASCGKEEKSPTQEPSPDKKKNRTPNYMKRLVGSFRRKTEMTRPMPTSEAVEELCTAPVVVQVSPVLPEPIPATVAAPLSTEMPPSITPAPAPIPADTEASTPGHLASSLAPEMPEVIAATPVQKPTHARQAPAPRSRSRFARPKAAPLPFPLLAPSPTPAADPLPLPDTSVAAAKAAQVRVRYLPFGTDAAKLDRQVYGSWPNAVQCKDCGGTGYPSGVVVGLMPCDECDGRGWNPPMGAPIEITVSVN
jgi:hypothetical protein